MTIKNPEVFGLYTSIVSANPMASRREIADKFRAELLRNPELFQAFVDEAVFDTYAYWRPEKIGETVQVVGTPVAERRAEVSAMKRRAPVKRAATALAEMEERLNRIILLNQVMSNGKMLRDCTYAEIERESGWLGVLACQGDGREVIGKRQTEDSVREIKRRFETGWKRKQIKVAS